MNQSWVKLLLFGLVILLVLAPFAGLAPLMLILLVAAIGSAFWTIVRTFFGQVDTQDAQRDS
ncbi:MAG: hypothetical protein ACFB4I_23840 [Cyanophyceae cyanobacterium]